MRAAADGDGPADTSAAERVVRAEIARTQHEARITFRRGVALIAAMPVVCIAATLAAEWFGTLVALLAFIATGMYILVGGIAGFSMMVVGVAEHRRSAHQLRELDAMRQLPEARLVSR